MKAAGSTLLLLKKFILIFKGRPRKQSG
ncbi:Unannotated, partial [Lentimonas sp. CC19]